MNFYLYSIWKFTVCAGILKKRKLYPIFIRIYDAELLFELLL